MVRLALTLIFLMLCCPAQAALMQASDLLVGNGTRGPFPLTWRQFTANTESVRVDSFPQTRGADYTIDSANGTITLARPLPPLSMASVTYAYDPERAVRGGSGLVLPVSLDIMRGETGILSLSALYRLEQSALQTRKPGSLTLGLGGEWNGGGNNALRMRLRYAPALALAGTDEDEADRRMGLHFGGSVDASRYATLSFDYARAGEGMTAAALDGGMEAGRQSLTLRGQVIPMPRLLAEMVYRQRALLDAPEQATEEKTFLVTADPAGGVRVQAMATDTDEATALSLTATVRQGDTLSLNASAEQKQRDDALAAEESQKATLALKLGENWKLNAFVGNQDGSAGQRTVSAVGTELRPLSNVTLSGRYQQLTTGSPIAGTATSVSTAMGQISLAPLRDLKLMAAYTRNPTDESLRPRLGLLRQMGLETRLGLLSLKGGYNWLLTDQGDADHETLNLNLGLRLSHGTELISSYDRTLNGRGLQSTERYRFGLRHSLGDRFTFGLTGDLKSLRNGESVAAPDYTTSANLGVKF